ncbi:MAG: DnaJ domain-containing protein [Gammaproteobacteria bacterium]|nr:DnaJ domain-containing protein [Gammaproteobacteria bacterium]
MKNRRNYYQILHVQADAPKEVIRSSYQTMMQKLKMHPDLGGRHDEAAVVNEAYSVLMNDTARAEYDTNLSSNPNVKQRAKNTNPSTTPIRQNKKNFHAYNKQQCAFCNTQHNMGNNIGPDDVCPKCDSPVFPAKKQTEKVCGKRTIQRINKEWTVRFYNSWPNAEAHIGKTKNVSLNGMQLITPELLDINQLVKIMSSELDTVANVVNRQLGSNEKTVEWSYGLEFLTLRFHQAHGTFISLAI